MLHHYKKNDLPWQLIKDNSLISTEYVFEKVTTSQNYILALFVGSAKFYSNNESNGN